MNAWETFTVNRADFSSAIYNFKRENDKMTDLKQVPYIDLKKSMIKAIKVGNGEVVGNILGGFAAHYYKLDLQETAVFPEIRITTDRGFNGLSYEVALLKNNRVCVRELMVSYSQDDPAFFFDGTGGNAVLVGIRNITANTISYNLNIKQLGVNLSIDRTMPLSSHLYMQNQNIQHNYVFSQGCSEAK